MPRPKRTGPADRCALVVLTAKHGEKLMLTEPQIKQILRALVSGQEHYRPGVSKLAMALMQVLELIN